MISWTIPREKVLTGYTEETSGSSSSVSDNDIRQIGTDFSAANSLSGTTTYAGKSYTSHGLTGSTTYFSSSYSSEYVDFTETDYQGVYSTTIFSSGITTESLFSYFAQTSSTQTDEYTFAVNLTTETTGLGWSYANSSFFQTETLTTENITSHQTGTWSYDVVIESGAVLYSGLADTIVQAASSEIIWYYSSISAWSGLTAATERATSATRVTIPPLMVLTLIPQVTLSTNGNATSVMGNGFHSYNYEDTTYNTSYAITTATTKATTSVYAGELPNETTATTTTEAILTTESFAVTVVYSDEGTLEATDGSTRIFSFATVSDDSPGNFYSGASLTWDASRTKTTAYSLTATAPIVLCAASQSSTSSLYVTGYTLTEFSDSYGRSVQDASGRSTGKTINQNTYLPQPPICGLNMGNILSQSKFVPRAAKIGSSSGYWFELNVSDTISNVTYAHQARSPLTTVMPTTVQGATYNSNSVTFSRSTTIPGQAGTTTTTSSGLIQLQGVSTTTNFAAGPIGVWGGTPAEGETFANIAGADGVYLNRIGGQTSSFRRGATTFSQSLALSSFVAIKHFAPPLGGDAETLPSFGYWTEARNSTALPPVMPPEF